MQQRWWNRAAVALVCIFGATQVSAQALSINTLPVLQASTPIPGSTHVPGDFDGNGVSDMAWFNPTTSQFGYWLMDVNDTTGVVSRTSYKNFNVTAGYFVGAIGDFNGDGLSDLVFTSSNNDLYLWTNNGAGGFTSTSLGTYPAGWILEGAGDVDGDGQDDLLWLNPSQCEFAYWLMKNGVRVGSKTITISCNFYPIAVGYFTPTNRLSIIWSNGSELYIWDSTTAGFSSYNNVPLLGVGETPIAFGGSYAGGNIIYQTVTTSAPGASSGIEHNYFVQRTFNPTTYAQTNLVLSQYGSSTQTLPLNGASAGTLVEGRQTNWTSVITNQTGSSPSVTECTPNNGNPLAQPPPSSCTTIAYPQGWYLLGSMGNGFMGNYP